MVDAKLFSQVKDRQDYMRELRRYFHQNPEPSLEEFKTAEKIEAELDAAGIPHKRVGKTGVWGTITGAGSGGGVVVLRADTDALRIQDEKTAPYRSRTPGVMHACGHDAHTAALIGAARVLQENRGCFAGEIRLVFQQAEEIGAGAKEFIAAGVLEGAGRVLGVHVASDIPAGKAGISPGPNNASVDFFRVTVHGKSAHVSTPQKGADALYAACQMVTALQGIVTRRTSPIETVIIGIGTLNAGSAYNIVAENAVLEGTLRTFTQELREEIKGRIAEVSGHIAAVSGTERDIEWKDFASVLINDAAVCREAAGAAAAFLGEDNVLTDRPRSLGGDDFAEFLLHVPGVYVKIGSGNAQQPDTLAPHHNCCFDIDESALVHAAGLYAVYAAWYLGAK